MPTTYAELAILYANARNQILALEIKIEALNKQAVKDAHTIEYLQGEVNKANEYVSRQSNNSFQMGD